MAIVGRPTLRGDLITGMSEGLTGWRKAPKPASWERFLSTLTGATESRLSQQARQLSVLFGDGLALEEIKRTALDSSAELEARRAALQTLIDSQPPDLKPLCEQLLSVRFLNPVAARGLALFNFPEVGAKLAGAWGKFHLSERPQLLATLVSRASFAHALLDAVETGQIPKDAITPYHARQINSLGEAALSQKLTAVWGALRDAGENKTAAIAAYKGTLPSSVLAQADLSAGRAVFAQSCAACHTLYGEGGKLGPELTGAGRDNLD
jgi:cytochrome c553